MQDPATGPLRLVIDTNAALDLLLFRDARLVAVREQLVQRRAVWFATGAMREEFAWVLARPALARYSPDSERLLTEFDQRVERVADPAPSPLLRCRDGSDQMFIDLALALRPATLITHDRDLLALARRAAAQQVTISSPAAGAPGAGERRGSRR